MKMAPWALLFRSSLALGEHFGETLRFDSFLPSLPGPGAPRWKGRRTSKYMPHEGKREVERRRRQREKIEARRAAESDVALAA